MELKETRQLNTGIDGRNYKYEEYTLDEKTGELTLERIVDESVEKTDEIIEVGIKPTTEEKIIPYVTKYEYDSDLFDGEKITKVKGEKGKQRVYSTYTVDENTGEVKINSSRVETVKEPTDEVIVLGTKERQDKSEIINEAKTDKVSVKKQWILDDGSKKPNSIDVQLYKNGKKYGKSVTLSKLNNWEYTWVKLPKKDGEKITWTVKEVKEPKGFKATESRKGNNITITNDDVKKIVPHGKNSKKPSGAANPKVKTGDNAKPGVIIAIMIIALAIMGIILRRRKK